MPNTLSAPTRELFRERISGDENSHFGDCRNSSRIYSDISYDIIDIVLLREKFRAVKKFEILAKITRRELLFKK